MPGWIGPWEIAILLLVALLVFGPKRLPEMGKSIGKGMREFKESVTSVTGREDEPALPPEPAAEEAPVSDDKTDTTT